MEHMGGGPIDRLGQNDGRCISISGINEVRGRAPFDQG